MKAHEPGSSLPMGGSADLSARADNYSRNVLQLYWQHAIVSCYWSVVGLPSRLNLDEHCSLELRKKLNLGYARPVVLSGSPPPCMRGGSGLYGRQHTTRRGGAAGSRPMATFATKAIKKSLCESAFRRVPVQIICKKIIAL